MKDAEKEVISHLRANGRSRVREIASGIDYSTGYVRQVAKELLKDGKIEGEKPYRIPAYIINGDYVVVSGDRKQLLYLVQRYAPSSYSRAEDMSTDELQSFVRDHVADQVTGGPWIWMFWV